MPDGVTPYKIDHYLWGARLFEQHGIMWRRVAQTFVSKDVRVSTVFLGLDHSWDEGPPVLWETMIFGGIHDDYQERYTSYKDARLGHERAVVLAREGLRWRVRARARVVSTFERSLRVVSGGRRRLRTSRKKVGECLLFVRWLYALVAPRKFASKVIRFPSTKRK